MSATTALAPSRSAGLRPRGPRPTRPAGAVPGQVRLSRRGRLALVAVLAVLAFLAVSLGQAALGAFRADAGASGSATSSDAARTWVVQPGETLWSIATRVAPGTDPRETVARIVQMNDLPSSSVLVGQEIFVPA
jgi:hypothetical protein